MMNQMRQDFFQLLQKYDVAGPRYTSYPTVPAWTTEVGEKDYAKNLGTLKPGEHLSLYFHIPFCEKLCHFCGCMKVITKDHSRSREYVDLLKVEMERVASRIPPKAPSRGTALATARDGSQARGVVQAQFGGGSPNYLQPEELKEIVDHMRSLFTLLPDAELSIEMHPRTSSNAFCEMVAQLGFNRISLGVQDFDPKVQKLISRNQTYEQTEEMMVLLRRLGLRAFNFDLIYGLPGQTLEGWGRTHSQVLHLKPDRLAVYSYAHVPWLKPYQRSFEDKDLPPPELKLRLFERAYETYTKNGYRLIGMDHFALREDALSKALDDGTVHRNFMGYSTKAEAHQIGFGTSSISYVAGNYFQNEKENDSYYAAIRKKDHLATYRGYLLNQDDLVRRDLIRRIMCCNVLDIPAFERQWGIKFADYFVEELPLLSTFVQDGLLQVSPSEIRVVGEGFLFLRNIAMVFDRYLAGIREKATNPVFSRTV